MTSSPEQHHRDILHNPATPGEGAPGERHLRGSLKRHACASAGARCSAAGRCTCRMLSRTAARVRGARVTTTAGVRAAGPARAARCRAACTLSASTSQVAQASWVTTSPGASPAIAATSTSKALRPCTRKADRRHTWRVAWRAHGLSGRGCTPAMPPQDGRRSGRAAKKGTCAGSGLATIMSPARCSAAQPPAPSTAQPPAASAPGHSRRRHAQLSAAFRV